MENCRHQSKIKNVKIKLDISHGFHCANFSGTTKNCIICQILINLPIMLKSFIDIPTLSSK